MKNEHKLNQVLCTRRTADSQLYIFTDKGSRKVVFYTVAIRKILENISQHYISTLLFKDTNIDDALYQECGHNRRKPILEDALIQDV